MDIFVVIRLYEPNNILDVFILGLDGAKNFGFTFNKFFTTSNLIFASQGRF